MSNTARNRPFTSPFLYVIAEHDVNGSRDITCFYSEIDAFEFSKLMHESHADCSYSVQVEVNPYFTGAVAS